MDQLARRIARKDWDGVGSKPRAASIIRSQLPAFVRPAWDLVTSFLSHIEGRVPADAISSMRTKENALSVWCCSSNDPQTIDDVVLALVTAPNPSRSKKLEKAEIVTVSAELIEAAGFSLELRLGSTPVADLKPRHRDLISLDSLDLALLGRLLLPRVAKKGNAGPGYQSYTRIQQENLIKQAVAAGRVQQADLDDKLQTIF